MKKLLACLLVVVLALLPCAAMAEIFTIEMSDATKEYRAKLKAQHQNESLKEESYETILAELQARENLDIPEVDTVHPMTKLDYGEYAVYTLNATGFDKILLYIHGGAYAYNIVDMHIQICDRLADVLNAKVYMPIYPLAPQATWKEAYALLDALYADILKEGLPIVIMGDSAGGGLSLAYTEYLKEQNMRLPEKMILLSPWVDVTTANEYIAEYEKYDLTLASYAPIELGKLWAGDTDVRDYRVSPIYGDLSELPDTLIIVGTDEIMYPDNVLLYEKMLRAGNENVCLIIGEGFWHVFPASKTVEQERVIALMEYFVNA